MAELNVDPAELLRHACSYDELAGRAQLILPQSAAEVQRVADTHGPIGAPVAAGLARGWRKPRDL